MSDKDLKFIEGWRVNQEKGWFKFSLINGSLWAVFTYVALRVINFFFEEDAALAIDTNLLLELFVWLLAGVFLYGPVVWHSNQRIYKKKIQKLELDENE